MFQLGPITARAEAGQRLVELYPQHRVEAPLEELDIDAHAERADARSWATRMRRPPPW